ncbi:MAG: sigma-70 family RNA polymerase sigma factor [Bacillota bacterium]|nr:sigma-70 family RNA polymerase sigma factor [Bacillota bacterium]
MDRTSEERKFFEARVFSQYRKLFRFLYTLCRDEETARDMVQETMAACWEKLELIRQYEDLEGALLAISKNKLRDHYRKEKQRGPVISMPMEDLAKIQGAPCDFEALIREEDTREMLSLIDKLRPEFTQIILLHHYYEIPLQEIAEILNVNYNTVLTWHYRALRNLGKLAEEAGLGKRRQDENDKKKADGKKARHIRAVE